MARYSKIRGCCAQAALDGFDYAWIDSCCIDKTSSSELSEAINSMFSWYSRAQVCYAYLSDVPAGGVGKDHLRVDSYFRASEWFTRGWTLQELLAPRSVVFFDRDWVDIGTRHSLQGLVSAITGVKNMGKFEHACVAQKMSWASRRRTTRIEDQAYFLMGLFGVNMPPLYGEGSNAFYRLQLEILKHSDDESLFAWTEQGSFENYVRGDILAPSPAAFSDCGSVVRRIFDVDTPEFTMTNKGLRMELKLLKEADTHVGVLLAPLNCSLGDGKLLVIQLGRNFKDRFFRLPSMSHITLENDMNLIWTESIRTLVYVKGSPLRNEDEEDIKLYCFEFTTSNLLEHGFGFPGSLFVGNPKYPQARVAGSTNIKFSLKRRAQGSLASVAYKFITFLSKEKAWEKVFTVCLEVESLGPSISLLVPVSPSRVGRWSGFDRVSAPLYSGMSVNVALKVRDEGVDCKCVVDVNINPEGKLRWPSTKSEGVDPAVLDFDVSQWS